MTTALSPPPTLRKGALVALGTLTLATGALESVVTPTLPLLQRELGMTRSEGALLSIVLLITGALVTPVAGKLGDRYGGKPVLVRLMWVVCLGGLVSAAAPSTPVLLAGQVLQGAMVGAVPLSFIVVRKHLPTGSSKVAIGVISGLFIAGGMVGTLTAGPVAEQLSRHWMFALPTFALVAATTATHLLLPQDPPGREDGGRIDWPGFALLSGSLVTLLLVLALAADIASAPLVLAGLVVLLAVLVTAWVAVERRAAAPMVDLRMLALPTVWKSCLLTFVLCIGTSSAIYLVPQLFELSGDGYGFGANATLIGLYLIPGAIAAVVAGPLGGFSARRFGTRGVISAATVVMAASLVLVAVVHSEVWHLVVAKMLIALASGVAVTALLANTATSVDEGDTGIATGLVLVTRVLGFAVGVQAGGALLTAATPAGSDVPAESAFVIGFAVAGAITALGLLITRTMSKGVTR
ncbi:Predicted arabinose efflux permease, MFS family [Lentzea fradiae]|uniref:Predicted arabinose efflux permease, MFS family n=1 Tax=Lentzea fradiae TaxID=200378 RepID=A0A1G7R1U8_9PSEU|nr:MFS transporter [Lentzea fradiae]SDG04725.1 Predicted arabinose efflux permease, MFS family [Lentzea fradiae]